MPDLYPEIEPYVQGMLEVIAGDLVYWEGSGKPQRQACCRVARRSWLGVYAVASEAVRSCCIPRCPV
jgi:hypothetical protein